MTRSLETVNICIRKTVILHTEYHVTLENLVYIDQKKIICTCYVHWVETRSMQYIFPCSWRASAVALVGTSGLQWDFRKEPWQLKFKRNNSANTILIDLTSNWVWRHVWNFGVNFFAVSDFVDKIYQPLSVPCVPPSILQKRFIRAHKYEEKVVLMACTQWICIY